MSQAASEMPRGETNRHLSQLATRWTTLLEAIAGPGDSAAEAQRRLIGRYGTPIYRYLLASVRDPDAADELMQEFALRLVRGDFRRVDPARGRFRDFLKTSLYHLIVDHQRRQRRQMQPLMSDPPEVSRETAPEPDADREFVAIWRAELMDRAWNSLAQWEQQTGQPLHTVLRYRTDHPNARSPEMAQALAMQFAKPITDGWIRKRLHLAREKFTDLLLDEVAQSLASPTVENLEQELMDLDLLDYCRPALERWRNRYRS